jgi:hypothetical protein
MINSFEMVHVSIVNSHVIHVLMKHNVKLACQNMGISMKPIVLYNAHLDIGMTRIINVNLVSKLVKLVMVLHKMIV